MDKYVLRGGLNLSQYSLSLLPPHLGGFSPEASVDMSDRTAAFIDAINTASPAGFKGSLSSPRRDGSGFTSFLDAEDSVPEDAARLEESTTETSDTSELKESKTDAKTKTSDKSSNKSSEKSD